LVANYEDCFEREYGSFWPVVKDILEKYLVLGLPDVSDAR
jgi:hypothetical protein